jgi:hypothetical protein
VRHDARATPVLTAFGAAILLLAAAPAFGGSAARAARPKTEHVPLPVSKVSIHYTAVTTPKQSKAVKLTTAQKKALTHDFDALHREPAGTVHCQIAGGPVDTVTFVGKHHTWVARQAACTNVQVTRDGKTLPTLLPSSKWSKAIKHDLTADS